MGEKLGVKMRFAFFNSIMPCLIDIFIFIYQTREFFLTFRGKSSLLSLVT